MKGRSLIVLVDDNVAGRLLVRTLLQSAGLKPDSSGSAVEAAKPATRTASRISTRSTTGTDRVA